MIIGSESNWPIVTQPQQQVPAILVGDAHEFDQETEHAVAEQ